VHELSVALSLVEVAGSHLRGALRGRRVDAVHLRLGPLAGVAKDALLFSFDAASRGTVLEGARLVIEEVPVAVFCARCQTERVVGQLLFRCPVCGMPASDITRGRELELTALEVSDDATPDP
jgi:hydrogenase nickel incorporation protein HypA/HybF